MEITRHGIGPLMSQAVVRGDTVHLAGQVGRGETVGEQTRAVLSAIDGLLAAAGSEKSRILSANVWLTDIGTIGEMNEAWREWVDPENPPARATVEARLAAPEYLVEIMVVAAR